MGNELELSHGCRRTMTLGGLRRHVAELRVKCSAFELETDRLKRDAEKAGKAPAIRNLIDAARSMALAAMRQALRDTEAQIATWRPVNRVKPVASFGRLVARALTPRDQGE